VHFDSTPVLAFVSVAPGRPVSRQFIWNFIQIRQVDLLDSSKFFFGLLWESQEQP